MFKGQYEFSGREAAEYLEISYETFCRYVREKRLVMLNKPSGKRYITLDILDSFKKGTLTTEQIMNYTSISTLPLELKVNLKNAEEYEEYSEKNVKYYSIKNPSITSDYTDLRVETDGAVVMYTLGRINKETDTFESIMEWVD